MSDERDDDDLLQADEPVRVAIERLKLAAEAEKDQRQRELDDLAFQVPEKQWTDDAIRARKGQNIDGVHVPPRPMLSIPKLDQPIQLILNAEKAAHLGVQVHPLSEDADDDTAEIMQGLYRCIERNSRASLARSWAFERGVKAGRGAYRILTEPAHDYASTKDLDIVIKRILYQDSVYFDPFAIEPDWRDGEWAFVVSWMQWAKYKRVHKQKKVRKGDGAIDLVDSRLATLDDGELTGLLQQCPDWIKGEGEGRAVLIAEYFCIEGEGADRKVMWRLINGIEVLDEREWMGKYIPIVPVIGRELIPFDGERRWTGVYGPNKDAQRLFNHAASTAVESAASEPRAPFMVAEGQEEGHEKEFELANQRNLPYIRYKPTSLDGVTPIPPPQRTQVDTSKLSLSMQMLSMSNEFIHAGTQMFEPSLGKNSPNVKTKGATLALQQQAEQSNSNWMDNLVEISMPYEALVILDLMPKVYDRPGRIARCLGTDDKETTVALNAPFVPGKDTARPRVLLGPNGQPMQPPAGVQPDQVKRYDLSKGIYGVSVSVGKGYKSRMEQGADVLGQIVSAEPELLKIVGDVLFNFSDFPGHDVLAERFKKMLPPPLQDNPGEDPQIQLDQAKAQIQQMQQQLAEAAKMIETDKVKVEGDIEREKIKAMLAVELQKMKDATAIRVKEIDAAMKGLLINHEADHEAVALGLEHAHTSAEAEKDRAHERDMAARTAAVAMTQAAQQHGQNLEAGDIAHQQALVAGDAGHQQALEQAQQAADLAPKPETDA